MPGNVGADGSKSKIHNLQGVTFVPKPSTGSEPERVEVSFSEVASILKRWYWYFSLIRFILFLLHFKSLINMVPAYPKVRSILNNRFYLCRKKMALSCMGRST